MDTQDVSIGMVVVDVMSVLIVSMIQVVSGGMIVVDVIKNRGGSVVGIATNMRVIPIVQPFTHCSPG